MAQRLIVYTLLILETTTGLTLDSSSCSLKTLPFGDNSSFSVALGDMPRRRIEDDSDADELSPVSKRRQQKTSHMALARSSQSQAETDSEREQNTTSRRARRARLRREDPAAAARVQVLQS